MQLSFFPQLLQSKHDYIVKRLLKNENYDLRDDKKLADSDIVGFCRKCGHPITKSDVMCVNALTYTRFNLGPNANGPITVRQEYECHYIGCAEEND